MPRPAERKVGVLHAIVSAVVEEWKHCAEIEGEQLVSEPVRRHKLVIGSRWKHWLFIFLRGDDAGRCESDEREKRYSPNSVRCAV